MSKPNPEDRVCPRCGESAHRHEYCQTCGLHLHSQPELSTRAEWEERQLNPRPGLAARFRGGATLLTKLRSQSTRTKIGLGGLAAIAVVFAGIALAGSGDEGASSPEVESISGPDPGLECIDSWNSSDPGTGGRDGGNFGKLWFKGKEAYAAVGFSADFPDQCLVTLALPEFDQATQLQETSPGDWKFQGNSEPSQIPASAKQWNATRASDGALSVGAP